MKIESAVYSSIKFPLGQDALSITKAINELIKEGWVFTLENDCILMSRSWVICESEAQGLAQEKSNGE